MAAILCDEEIDRDFILNRLKGFEAQISHMGEGRGSVFGSITGKQLRELPIPLPPLEEQKRIADRLNQAEEIKNTNAESGKRIEELKSALFQKAFRGEL